MASGYDQQQLTLWQEKVRLDEGFLKSLREHPVPVREEAISAIGTRSLPIDIYIWLAYRLHVLTKPTPVSWLSLHSQFGAGFKKVRQFKPTMFDGLSMALPVYPRPRFPLSRMASRCSRHRQRYGRPRGGGWASSKAWTLQLGLYRRYAAGWLRKGRGLGVCHWALFMRLSKPWRRRKRILCPGSL